MSDNITEVFTPEAYLRIKALDNPHKINKELSTYSAEFKASYVKYGNMLRNKKFRDNNKDDINLKRKISRAEAKISLPVVEKLPVAPVIKPFNNVKTIINPEDVDKTIIAENKANIKIKDLNPNTITSYIAVIKTIYSKYNNKPIADDAEVLKMLRNEKYNTAKLLKQNMYIIDNINDITINYAYTLKTLYNIFCRTRGKNIDILKKTIYPYFIKYKEVFNNNANNITANTEITSKISFDKNEVLKNTELIEDDYEKLMYMLLFLIPTRRMYDYRITRIATKKKDTENEMFNWYYQGKIYINNTKNQDKMILQLPTEIIAIINKLPTDTDYIFGKAYIESTLSRKFSNITNRIYNSQFTPLDIRRLFATHSLNTTNDNGDVNNLFKNAKNMGHSLNQHLQYVKKPKI